MNAADVMTPDVICAAPDTPLPELVRLMLDNQISALPIVEDGRIVGIVSEGDLLRRAEAGTEPRPSRWLELVTSTDRLATDYTKTAWPQGRRDHDARCGHGGRHHADRRGRAPARGPSDQARAGDARRQAGRHRQPAEPAAGTGHQSIDPAGHRRRQDHPRRLLFRTAPSGLGRRPGFRQCRGGGRRCASLGHRDGRGAAAGDRGGRGKHSGRASGGGPHGPQAGERSAGPAQLAEPRRGRSAQPRRRKRRAFCFVIGAGIRSPWSVRPGNSPRFSSSSASSTGSSVAPGCGCATMGFGNSAAPGCSMNACSSRARSRYSPSPPFGLPASRHIRRARTRMPLSCFDVRIDHFGLQRIIGRRVGAELSVDALTQINSITKSLNSFYASAHNA